jgi:hypothetical protein
VTGYDDDMEYFLRAAMTGGVTPAPRPTRWARLVALVTRRPARLPRSAPKTWVYTPPDPDEPDE